jgi:hypothetical protein
METMTTKKTTTKKTARRRPTMKDPARSIIADAEGYDEDTRMAVQASLDRNDAKDLAETVRLAERGDSIADLSVCQDRDERAASAILALVNSPDVPEFIAQTVRDVLDLASDITGIEYKDAQAGDELPSLITVARARIGSINMKPTAQVKHRPAEPKMIDLCELYDEQGTQRNPFDSDIEAREAVQAFCSHLFGRSEAASLFLLIVYALANEHDEGTRSLIYYEACRFLTDEVEGVGAVFEADHMRMPAELRKGSNVKGGGD